MTLKQFLKPDWRKIVLTIIFILLSTLYNTEYPPISSVPGYYYGFPLAYLEHHGTKQIPGPIWVWEVIYSNLILNVIFWYILSCFIVWIYDKVKKK